MASKIPKPPEHLADAGQALWSAILADFDIRETHHLQLLTRACEQADRIASYRAKIAEMGPTVEDRFDQIKANPLLAEERAAANLMRLCLRELNLDATTEVPRLPRGQRYGA